MPGRLARKTPNERLRRARNLKGWSQQDVANSVGTDDYTISRWENGRTNPSAFFRQKLCLLFGKNAEELGLLEHVTAEVDLPQSSDGLRILPYRRNLFFTGRSELLDRVHCLFQQSEVILNPTVVAICGMGGVGKTQVLTEYAYRYSGEYEAIFWLRASSQEYLQVESSHVVSQFDIQPGRVDSEKNAISLLQAWLKMHDRWLLILDELTSFPLLDAFLPVLGKGHVLLATRQQSTGTLAYSIQLNGFSPHEGALLLLRRAKRLSFSDPLNQALPTDVHAALSLSTMFEGLPLALDQAGAYIEEAGCSLNAYLTRYKREQAAYLRKRGENSVEHLDSVSATLTLSFEQLEQKSLAAANLLRLCTFLDSEAIPEALLLEGAPSSGLIPQSNEEQACFLDEMVFILRSASLVDRCSEKDILHVHRLVGIVLQTMMSKEEQVFWTRQVILLLKHALSEDKMLSREGYLSLHPHIWKCAEMIKRLGIVESDAADVLSKSANYLQLQAQYKQAEKLYQQAYQLQVALYGRNHSEVGQSITALGEVAQSRGAYQRAEAFYRLALHIQERLYGPEHPNVAGILNALASLCYAQGRFHEIEALFQRALQIRERAFGAEHKLVAESLNDLGVYYYYRSEYQQAEYMYRRALAIEESLMSSENLMTATTLFNLARLSFAKGDPLMAKRLYRQSLVSWRKKVGSDHPLIASGLSHLADLYVSQGRYRTAWLLASRAFSIREQLLSDQNAHHSRVASLRQILVLAVTYGAHGGDMPTDFADLQEISFVFFERDERGGLANKGYRTMLPQGWLKEASHHWKNISELVEQLAMPDSSCKKPAPIKKSLPDYISGDSLEQDQARRIDVNTGPVNDKQVIIKGRFVSTMPFITSMPEITRMP